MHNHLFCVQKYGYRYSIRDRTKTHFLIKEINLVNTSFKGFNLTGLEGFLTSESHMKLGPVPVLDLFMPFISLPALRGGKTSLRPVGRDADCTACDCEVPGSLLFEERAARLAILCFARVIG
jgi:hypothetical protein